MTKKHQKKGIAFDTNRGIAAELEKSGLAAKYGFARNYYNPRKPPNKDESWHFTDMSARNAGTGVAVGPDNRKNYAMESKGTPSAPKGGLDGNFVADASTRDQIQQIEGVNKLKEGLGKVEDGMGRVEKATNNGSIMIGHMGNNIKTLSTRSNLSSNNNIGTGRGSGKYGGVIEDLLNGNVG